MQIVACEQAHLVCLKKDTCANNTLSEQAMQIAIFAFLFP